MALSGQSVSIDTASAPDAPLPVENPLQAVIVCAPNAGDCSRLTGGITLAERLYRQLQELDDIASIVVLKPPQLVVPLPSRRIRKNVEFITAPGANAWEMLRNTSGQLDRRCLVIGANLLIDQRLLEWLARQPGDVLLTDREGNPPEIAGCIHREVLEDTDLQNRNSIVAVSRLPSYWETMHGDVPLHLMRIEEARDEELAWEVLLDHIQRRTQELPSRYFDIPFENRLVRLLAPTAISANQVTILTTLLGFLVAVLYAEGWLRVGVLLAILVEVLDGVDGKLARITRTTSNLGEQEHILDFFYENSWYLALGFFFARQDLPHAFIGAVAMVAFDLTDNIAYALLDVKWGRSLDNVNPFLQRFRLIGGRRNIYTWIFLPGFFFNVAPVAFAVAIVWAGVTATIHLFCCATEVFRLLRS
jgi:phosphatidylglycerophosphate synthase